MEKKKFSLDIRAPKEKVWKTLWSDETYRQWTKVFAEGSHAEGDWKEGSQVLFLDGKGSGMFSLIVKNVPNQLMSIRHLGVVKDGVEQAPNEETEKWGEALETYTLTANGDMTNLTVEMDIVEEYMDFFNNTFPKALNKIKEISEG